jgi:hypothetical protein
MGLNITKLIGGNIDEYDGQNILYNSHPYYNNVRKPLTIKEREFYSRRHSQIIPVNYNY